MPAGSNGPGAPGPVDWILRAQSLLKDQQCAVLTMLNDVRGSTPRGTGTWMLISSTASLGTLGGGELERMISEAAHAMLSDQGSWRRSTLRCVLGPDLNQCCGGAVAVTLEPLDSTALPWLGEAAEAIGSQTRAAVLFDITDPGRRPEVIKLPDNLASIGEVQLQPLVDNRPQLFLFGAGHVGRSVAAIAGQLPLCLTVIDSRESMRALIPKSDNVRVIDMTDLQMGIAGIPAGSAALVMTHSHELDYSLCRTLLANNGLIFVGLIGSHSKAKRFRRRLVSDGLPADTLNRLTSPIGQPGPVGKEPGVIALAALAEGLNTLKGARNQDGSAPDDEDTPLQHHL